MIELYGHPFSSYTWKAQIALHATGIPHQLKMVDAGHPDNSAFVQSAHPAGKFPVLREGDHVVVEAGAIVEYLAAAHPGHEPLLPRDPLAAAEVRMLERVFDHYVMGNAGEIIGFWWQNPDAAEGAPQAAARAGLLRAYRWLEDWLFANVFPNHVSLATCAAAPALFYADWVERIPADCPRLMALRAELLALEPVTKCVDAARPYRKLFPRGAPDRD